MSHRCPNCDEFPLPEAGPLLHSAPLPRTREGAERWKRIREAERAVIDAAESVCEAWEHGFDARRELELQAAVRAGRDARSGK